MPRARSGPATRARRKKILEYAEGYWGLKKWSFRIARMAVERAWKYAYRDRKVRKREFRKLWIIRLNAAARQYGLPYNQLMQGLKKAEIGLDRKVLADMAINDPASFEKVVARAKASLAEHIKA